MGTFLANPTRPRSSVKTLFPPPAYLTQENVELQELAANSGRLITTLVEALQNKPDENDDLVQEKDFELYDQMQESAFLALASLSSRREEIRMKVNEGVLPLSLPSSLLSPSPSLPYLLYPSLPSLPFLPPLHLTLSSGRFYCPGGKKYFYLDLLSPESAKPSRGERWHFTVGYR